MKVSIIINNVEKNWFAFQYLAAITCTLGLISSEMHYGWPSPSLPILINGTYTFSIKSEEASWLAIMPLLGAIFGAIITALIIDILGRKRLIIISSIPLFVSWLMIGFAETSILLHFARFIAGLTDGLSHTAVPMYLGEISEAKIRGLLSSMCPISIGTGLLLINIFGSFFDISTTAFVSSIIPLTLLITFVWMPESPYFLIIRDRIDDARKSLQILRGKDNVEDELITITKAIKEQNKNKGKFLDLFTTSSNRRALFVTLGLRSFQQLSGIGAIIIYCKTIFAEAKEFISPTIATIIYFSIQLLLSAISSFIVDVAGRRPLLIFSITGTTVILFIQGTFLYIKNCTDIDVGNLNFIPIACLLGFVVIYGIGLQNIPLVLMSEIFPTNIKAFALCLADIYFSLTVSGISKYFHAMNDFFGMHIPFFTFAIFCLLGLAFIIHYVPETKGRTLEDIQRSLK